MNRSDVYALIDGERAYQEMRLQRDGSTSPDGTHSPEEFLLYMEDYLNEAKKTAARVWGPECRPLVMDTIRKVTALGVACMEQHDTPARRMPEA